MTPTDEWTRIHRHAYKEGWVDEPPPDAPARGIATALALSVVGWAVLYLVWRLIT